MMEQLYKGHTEQEHQEILVMNMTNIVFNNMEVLEGIIETGRSDKKRNQRPNRILKRHGLIVYNPGTRKFVVTDKALTLMRANDTVLVGRKKEKETRYVAGVKDSGFTSKELSYIENKTFENTVFNNVELLTMVLNGKSIASESTHYNRKKLGTVGILFYNKSERNHELTPHAQKVLLSL